MRTRTVRIIAWVGALLLAAGGAACAAAGPAAPAAHQPDGSPGTWVGTWAAAPSGTVPQDPNGYPNYSLRNLLHVSVGGAAVRVHLSNAFRPTPLTMNHATVAVAAGPNTPRAVSGTMRTLTFGATRSPVIPGGAEEISDPVHLRVPAGSTLLVTTFVAGPGPVTWHPDAQQTSYFSTDGDHSADTSGVAYTRTDPSWYYVDAVDVQTTDARSSVVALGDSITDGYQSGVGANHRWPDYLAARLGYHRLGVLNSGISGNRVLVDAPNVNGSGPGALARLDRDVLTRTAARSVVVLEGVNDIGITPVSEPTGLEAGLQQIAAQARARGLRVIGGTILPYEGADYWTAAGERVRLAVNRWIRTSGVFDAVADFDAATRDPGDPHRLLAAYDSGDHLHPGDAGYRAMAAAVPLGAL